MRRDNRPGFCESFAGMSLSDNPRPVIAVIGAGAVGGYYGAKLAHGGFDVHFLLRSDYAAIHEKGLEIQSIHGDFTIPAKQLRAYDNPARMPKADLVIIALKATSNHLFDSLIRPLLKPDTALLTMQNGLG